METSRKFSASGVTAIPWALASSSPAQLPVAAAVADYPEAAALPAADSLAAMFP